MKTTILRGVLAFLLVVVLVGLHPPIPARAGGSGGHWTDIPPRLDGAAPASEWGGAYLLTYTHFSVRYQNDGQFLYLLLDVIGEAPASPPGLSHDENFALYVDTDADGLMESLYSFNYPSVYLIRASSTDHSTWIPGASCVSYGAAGFGPSLGSATPHRIYEMALRLSELSILPGHARTVSFYASSASPPPYSFTESTASTPLMVISPEVAYVYNAGAANGLSDATAFQTLLYNTDGIWATLVTLDIAASVDYSPYKAILMADDTGASSSWYGSAAVANKILQSKKPVVGIGEGGIDFLGTLGSYISHPNSASGGSASQVNSFAPLHSAWSIPSAVSTSSPVTLYSSGVSMLAIFTADASFPWKTMTRQAVLTYSTAYSPILSQSLNGTCYTLWGFRGQPGLLTADGKKLLSNLVWQPPCRPAVLDLRGSDGTLAAGIQDLLTTSGFPYEVDFATDAASVDYSGFQSILIDRDTSPAWNSAANVNAVVGSHLPVTAMGTGGIHFLQNSGLPSASTMITIATNQSQADLQDPLQAALRYPYPVSAPSNLTTNIDSTPGGGVTATAVGVAAPAVNETVIGYYVPIHQYRIFDTQPLGSACYQLFGFNSNVANLYPAGTNLLRNMLAHPTCNYPIMLPLLTK